jgi:acyl-CoA synthetase (NDP forming)
MIATAGPGEYRQAIETALAAPDVDALIVVFTAIDASTADSVLAGIGDGIAEARRRGAIAKPVLTCVMSGTSDMPPLGAGTETVPTCTFPENAARALGKVAAYAAWRREPAGLFWAFDDLHVADAREICRQALERGDTWLNDHDIWGVLSAFGFPVAVHQLARTADEAVACASVIGFPVVAKLASTQVTHKTDLGVVRLNLQSPDEVRGAFTDIVARATEAVGAGAIDGVLIQPMIRGGVETLFGITHDPLFGPLVAFGIGGVNVEVFRDVHFRVAPLTDRDADDLLRSTRAFPLLTGHRGRAAADLDALRDTLLRLSCLAEQVPEIVELDLNPVVALVPGAGCRVLDARIKVARPSGHNPLPRAIEARP